MPGQDTHHAETESHLSSIDLAVVADAKVLGRDIAVIYPEWDAHLADCATCKADLDDLLFMVESAYTAEIPRLPSYPTPNLAFLSDRAPQGVALRRAHRVAEAGRVLLRFSQALLDSLRPPTLLGATRGHRLYRYSQPLDLPDDMDLTVEIFEESGNDGHVQIAVTVDVPSPSPLDQANVLVVLRAAQHQWRQKTDNFGNVEFSAIPLTLLPHLEIEATLSPPTDV